VGQVDAGTELPWDDERFDWYHIILDDGTDGWVSGVYIRELE